MEEIKTSASPKPAVPTYLVIGDTGVGKSTFVNNILGA
jgi:putative ribosome biogenesis GTPase RsgA